MTAPELTRLVVVELDHSRRLVVTHAPVEVDLALAVVVHDHGHAPALCRAKAVLDPDAGKACLSEIDRHQDSGASLRIGNRMRPSRFDSFISMMPTVAVTST